MTLQFYFVGDLCLAGLSNAYRKSLSATWHRWNDLTKNADLTVANFECCIVNDQKYFDRLMAVPQSDCELIAKLSMDVASLANNHILDCGRDSLELTQTHLNSIGLDTVGAGRNIKEASAPLVVTRRGKRIAIISSTDATHYKAKKNRGGISPLSMRRLKKSIHQISDHVDLVVLCIHSDLEFTNYPAPWKVRLSRKLARAGADIIVHHHPHTLQGIELYEGTLIAYSLGNFIFPIHGLEYMENREGHVDESIILKVDINWTQKGAKSISYDLIPIIIDKENTTKFAEGIEADNIARKMSSYSDCLGNSEKLRTHYFMLCLDEAKRFVMGTYYTFSRDGLLAAYKYFKVHLTTRMHRNWMRGIITKGRF